jgi:hypothetical protein
VATDMFARGRPTNEEKALEFRYLSTSPSAWLLLPEDHPINYPIPSRGLCRALWGFFPDAAIEPYIMHRNWATKHLDGLWTAAGAF